MNTIVFHECGAEKMNNDYQQKAKARLSKNQLLIIFAVAVAAVGFGSIIVAYGLPFLVDIGYTPFQVMIRVLILYTCAICLFLVSFKYKPPK